MPDGPPSDRPKSARPKPARPTGARPGDDGSGPTTARGDVADASRPDRADAGPRARGEGGRSGGKQRGRGKDRADGPKGTPGRPTPVRELARAEAPPSPVEPDQESVRHVADDQEWTVRVLGRSGGRGAAAVPMLLLGFARQEDSEHELEALVVGRALSGLTSLDLDRAFRSARRPPPETDRAAPTRGRDGGRRGGATGRPGR